MQRDKQANTTLLGLFIAVKHYKLTKNSSTQGFQCVTLAQLCSKPELDASWPLAKEDHSKRRVFSV